MSAIPAEFDADFITHTFFPDYIHRPRDINRGQCYDWAYYAYCLWPDVKIRGNVNHSWIEYNGLWYDSENPKGLTPEQAKDRNRPRSHFFYIGEEEMNIERHKEWWNDIGAGRQYHWEDLEANLLEMGFEPVRT